MNVVQYGDWKISVDIEKTKEYYANYNREADQANRNFAEYCKNLSIEEKQFFESFGIDPVCCEIEHIGCSRKGEFPCGGYYLIHGSYLEHPKTEWVRLDEFLENNMEIDTPDPRVNIGIFQFEFKVADNEWDDEIPEMPEGFICVRFWCEDMKWLLDEPCEEKMYEEPRFWEIHKIIGNAIKRIKFIKDSEEESKQRFTEEFERLGIKSRQLTKKEVTSYKKEWLHHFTPEGADWKKVKKLCLKNGNFGVYLWHLFSYEIQKSKEGPEAIQFYNGQEKEKCILISSFDDLGFELENASKLSADIVEQLVDVIVTASDFSWTYAQTHEQDIGPYFYQKNS